MPDQAQLITSMDVYPHKKINFMLEIFHETLDCQESRNLISQENLWKENRT